MGPLPNMIEYLSDAIDILLVTYLIYKLIIVLRGTRAIQLFKGIIFIVVTWLLSTYFGAKNFTMANVPSLEYWGFSYFNHLPAGITPCIGTTGRGRIFSRSNQPDDQVVLRMVGEIIKAMQYMSKRRIGALIVLEKETGLTDYIETGIEIGGKVSSELLINIFIPNTPLHDGAVIIRKKMSWRQDAICHCPRTQ